MDPIYGRRDVMLLSELKRGYRSKPGRPERPLIERLTLHAHRIDLPGEVRGATPEGGQPLRVEAPLPTDFLRITKQLAKVRPTKR